MMLILFFLDNISVILMRESKISSYRPSFKMPLYPLFPILGMGCQPLPDHRDACRGLDTSPGASSPHPSSGI
jgi:hypothetical protein